MEKEDLEGELIYQEGKVQVRTHPRDPEAHNVWIGDNYLLLQRGCLEHFAQRTSQEDLPFAFNNYNPNIPYILEQEKISPEGFALILARARLKEQEGFAQFMFEEGQRDAKREV